MQSFVDKAREYMKALMKAGDYTIEDVAVMTESSVNTVKNFLALGGDLNDLVGYEKKKEIEVNSAISLKESYEMRIEDITNFYETRIEDVKALCEIRIADVHKCCETRIAELKQIYEEIIKDQREMFLKS